MRKLILFTVLICCVAAAGCSKDSEVKSFLSEFESVTKSMTAKLESGDIEGAKQIFGVEKANLKEGFDSFKNAREMQVSAETKKELEETVTANIKSLSSAARTAAIKTGDKAKAEELQTLLREYVGIFQM